MNSPRKTAKSKHAGPPRAILYLRCSTNEQAESGLGLSAQEAALRADCDRRGWQVADVLTDAGASGKSLAGRPALEVALARVEAGEAECLMVSKLDRLSRSLLDFAGLMARAQRGGWNVVALDLGIDLATPAGEFMASVMASAAQWERRIIGQRTKDALAIKRAEGVRLGRPPSLPREIIATIMELRLSGLSFARIATRMNDNGVPTGQGEVVPGLVEVEVAVPRSMPAVW